MIIDRSVPIRPALDEVRRWAADKRMFISSFMPGLGEHRRATRAAIAGIGATPVMFEEFGGREDPPDLAYQAEVGTSDVDVGILDVPYGRVLDSGLSATHAEYREAERLGLPVSVWATTLEREQRQDDFLTVVDALDAPVSPSFRISARSPSRCLQHRPAPVVVALTPKWPPVAVSQ